MIVLRIMMIARHTQVHHLCEVSGRFLGNPDEAPFPIARESQATKGSEVQTPYKSGMKLSPQALWKRVAAALYACQVGSARIQHLCFMSVTDGQFLSLTV